MTAAWGGGIYRGGYDCRKSLARGSFCEAIVLFEPATLHGRKAAGFLQFEQQVVDQPMETKTSLRHHDGKEFAVQQEGASIFQHDRLPILQLVFPCQKKIEHRFLSENDVDLWILLLPCPS